MPVFQDLEESIISLDFEYSVILILRNPGPIASFGPGSKVFEPKAKTCKD
jgi:hypothetical protein